MNKGIEAVQRAQQQQSLEDQQVQVQTEILLALHSVRTTLIAVLVLLAVGGPILLWLLLSIGMNP